MKKYFYLFLILPVLAFSQEKNYDYFVQFNTPQFAKKVAIDSLFNHKVFERFNKEDAKFRLNEFISFIDKTKAVIIHGNFTDSIPYYQISLPLRDDKGLQHFIQNKINQAKQDSSYVASNDSIADAIKSYPNYQIYSPKNDSYSIAWNKNYLIVYGLLDGFNNRDFAETEVTDTSAVDAEAVEEEPLAEKEIIENPTTDSVEIAGETVEDENAAAEEYDDEYYKKLEEKRLKEQELANIEKRAKQEKRIAMLFENGFVIPTSDKISTTADISSWVNYQSIYSKMNSFYSLLKAFSPNKPSETYNNPVKGMNVDFYFENGKARMEETVEYSESLAKIMGKVVSRKPNKNLFKYFPKQEPLGYMSYSINTEEVLKNYPEIMKQFLANLPFEKQDADIVMDLMSTIIDEEAIATLFDGDLSLFLHNIEPYKATVKTTTYNEDYEEVEEEKTITKTRPVFSLIMTSTHPTMADKLLNLGVRKNLWVNENGYYVVKNTAELGKFVIMKKGDVIIFTNGLDYLSNESKSDFSKKAKKELAQNYVYGSFDVQRFMKSYLLNQDLGSDTAKMLKVSNQFKNIQFRSSQKLKENKVKLEMEMNSNFSDKNIIIQALDLIDYLNLSDKVETPQ